MSRRTIILFSAGVAVLAIAAASVATVAFGGTRKAAPDRTGLPPATTQVTRTTLTQTEDVDGTLGYGEATVVSGRLSGTVTALPAEGSTVDRGKAMYTVDNRPVPLLYGMLPLYRRLAIGVEGADVKQFEENLAALGYQWFTVDDEYTSATATAVEEWQSDLGLPETGQVDLGRVLYGPGAVRIGEHRAHPGDPANGPILTYTGTVRLVTVALDVTKQDLVVAGAATTVKLPSGTSVAGTVTSVGTVATAATSSQGASTTTIEVKVAVAEQEKLGTLDRAPVEVTLVAQRRENVLTVPVAALLALAEGGHGLEIVAGTTTRVVAVKAGLFAGGRVEVSGDGIAPGTVVGVPA